MDSFGHATFQGLWGTFGFRWKLYSTPKIKKELGQKLNPIPFYLSEAGIEIITF